MFELKKRKKINMKSLKKKYRTRETKMMQEISKKMKTKKEKVKILLNSNMKSKRITNLRRMRNILIKKTERNKRISRDLWDHYHDDKQMATS